MAEWSPCRERYCCNSFVFTAVVCCRVLVMGKEEGVHDISISVYARSTDIH